MPVRFRALPFATGTNFRACLHTQTHLYRIKLIFNRIFVLCTIMPSLGLWCKIAISLSETHLAKSVLSFHETTSSFNLPRSLAQVHRCKEHRIAIYFTTDALLQAYSSRACRCEKAGCTWEPASPKARRSQRRRNINDTLKAKERLNWLGTGAIFCIHKRTMWWKKALLL